MANERGELPLQVLLDEHESETHSSYSYAAGARALGSAPWCRSGGWRLS